MLSVQAVSLLIEMGLERFHEPVDWMLLDYRQPEHAGAAAAAAARVKEFAKCQTWVKRLSLTATFSAFASRPKLIVHAYDDCIRLPGGPGTGVFEDVDVIVAREWVPGAWGEKRTARLHAYLFSAKRGLTYAHPRQDLSEYFLQVSDRFEHEEYPED